MNLITQDGIPKGLGSVELDEDDNNFLGKKDKQADLAAPKEESEPENLDALEDNEEPIMKTEQNLKT
jgi:hypothetical protein